MIRAQKLFENMTSADHDSLIQPGDANNSEGLGTDPTKYYFKNTKNEIAGVSITEDSKAIFEEDFASQFSSQLMFFADANSLQMLKSVLGNNLASELNADDSENIIPVNVAAKDYTLQEAMEADSDNLAKGYTLSETKITFHNITVDDYNSKMKLAHNIIDGALNKDANSFEIIYSYKDTLENLLKANLAKGGYSVEQKTDTTFNFDIKTDDKKIAIIKDAINSKDLSYTLSGTINQFFKTPEEGTLDRYVEVQSYLKDLDLKDYTLTNSTDSLDISALKGNAHIIPEAKTPPTLDLSNATIAADSTVTVKLAELKNGNKGDLSLENGAKSDQSVKLPSLEKIEGTLVIENMTVSSTAIITQVTQNEAFDKDTFDKLTTESNFELRLNTHGTDGFGSVVLNVAKDGENYTFTQNNTQYNDVVADIDNDNDTVTIKPATNSSISAITQGQIRTSDKITNDVLDFGNITKSDITKISITAESGWIDITLSLKDAGSIILDNIISQKTFDFAILNNENIAKDEEGNGYTISQDAGLIELIGQIGGEGTFVFDGA